MSQEEASMKNPVMSIRWFRVVTVFALASTVAVTAILLPAVGQLGVGVLLVLIVAAAVRLGWTAARSTAEVIADVDAEPIVAGEPGGPPART
jgi:hypothetical protein